MSGMKPTLLSGLAIAMLLLTGCRSYEVFQMEVLRPAYINQSVGENGVLLIDNAGTQPEAIGHSLTMPNRVGKDSVIQLSARSADAKPMLLGFLHDKLLDNGFYPEITVAANTWFPSMKDGSLDFLTFQSLTERQRAFLRDSTASRMWISLDGWFLKTETKVKPIDEVNSSTLFFTAQRNVYASTVWRVFDATTDTLMLAFKYNDTLFWERLGRLPQQAVNALPTVDSTLAEIADYMTNRIVKLLTPYWDPVARIYFISGSYRMKYGYDAIRVDNWNQAAAIWQEECENGVGRSAYRAAMNLILHYERLGDPAEALAWATKADELMNKPLSMRLKSDEDLLINWKETLTRRVAELERLGY